ncbi:MAG TPA: dNTP triphosphohydrolase [Bacteroidales bacterium]|nr:dNTP triphosphohydrolase [Bacteroidales bacterium]
MQSLKFKDVAIYPGNTKWKQSIRRERKLYKKNDDIRSEFSRDYNRILHSKAYRRLKHKTQVFYATQNDHVCTRIEHVTHVASVSYSIANYLGLNTELTNAIAIGHDLGHAPFGHEGEYILRKIATEELGKSFWHEKNSLFFVDKLETLPDLTNKDKNLNLTYAVRDGIISHCGEVNENAIFPRKEIICLEDIEKPNQYAPYTWEACVVKIADKISYLGRDIEDALTLKILDKEQIAELSEIVAKIKKVKIWQINNTILMNDFIINLCKMSTPEKGILFSEKYLNMINSVKTFNYKHIYKHKRLEYYSRLASLVINSIYSALAVLYAPKNKLIANLDLQEKIYPSLIGAFKYWLMKYSDIDLQQRKTTKFGNMLVYDIENEKDYKMAILHYISSMTDLFAMKLFGELTRF